MGVLAAPAGDLAKRELLVEAEFYGMQSFARALCAPAGIAAAAARQPRAALDPAPSYGPLPVVLMCFILYLRGSGNRPSDERSQKAVVE